MSNKGAVARKRWGDVGGVAKRFLGIVSGSPLSFRKWSKKGEIIHNIFHIMDDFYFQDIANKREAIALQNISIFSPMPSSVNVSAFHSESFGFYYAVY